MKDKILGALFGVAVGDALGAPLEFMSEKEIKVNRRRLQRLLLTSTGMGAMRHWLQD